MIRLVESYKNLKVGDIVKTDVFRTKTIYYTKIAGIGIRERVDDTDRIFIYGRWETSKQKALVVAQRLVGNIKYLPYAYYENVDKVLSCGQLFEDFSDWWTGLQLKKYDGGIDMLKKQMVELNG